MQGSLFSIFCRRIFLVPVLLFTIVCAAEIKINTNEVNLVPDKMKAFDKLRRNCSELLQEKYFDQKSVRTFLVGQAGDGSWADIDYHCKNMANWRTSEHLNRLRIMSAGWSSPASPFYQSAELGEGIKRGLEYWSGEWRESTNWWWNQIYVPMAMGHIFILAYDLLKDGPWLNAAMPYIDQATIKYDGQNRIWVAKGVLFKGILTADEKLVKDAHEAILLEIAYGKEAGIRVDGSFHQHGPQLQFGNYGLSYLASITVLVYYFSDTPWALTDIAPLRDFVINGMKWVLWKDVIDISAQGRQIWRDTQTEKKLTIDKSMEKLIEKDTAYADEYKKETLGNRMFFKSDYMVHRTGNFYASYRANSQHTFPVETYVIGDNRLGRYLSDGLLLVMRSGREYFNIAGCWEWNRLPGTTLPAVPLVEPGEDAPPKVISFSPARIAGESPYTGGVSDGVKYGAMIYTMNLDKVKANKAVFFADDIIVALGSGIESGSPYPVATTVEQSLLNGSIVRGENYFYHNNIGYSGKNIVLSTVKRKGDWMPLWGGYKNSEPDEKEIFQLTIDHGTSVRDGSYEYAIYPDTALKDMPAAIKSYQVLVNDRIVQAVKLKDNTIMAVFHQKGSLGDFSTDSAGVFIIGHDRIFAADPTQKKDMFELELNGKKYKVKLPEGEFAGSTIAVER